MDILAINHLTAETFIGVYEWEKKLKQTIRLDLEFSVNAAHIAQNDDLQDAVDYAALAKQTTEFIESNSFQLIETLASRVADFLINTFHLSWIRLKVIKMGAIPNAKDVSICIERKLKE